MEGHMVPNMVKELWVSSAIPVRLGLSKPKGQSWKVLFLVLSI